MTLLERLFSRSKNHSTSNTRRCLSKRRLRCEALEQRQLLSVTGDLTYPIVDTNQTSFYDHSAEIAAPVQGEAFYGQDAQYDLNPSSYTISGDGLTVFDNVTELTWTQSPDLDGDSDIDADDKLSFTEFSSYADTLNAQNYGGFTDWRTPTIKDLYSLIDFNGVDPPPESTSTTGLTPFIDADAFDFAYGDLNAGERIIDAQYWSSTEYVSTTMNGDHTVFGVNFADGRIKGYGTSDPMSGGDKTAFVLFVRGNTDYGVNHFVDNSDGTITDEATGLMWSESDSGQGMNWQEALAWVEQKNTDNFLGHDDWRLPHAKELQSIVDYTRSPDTTSSAAIDPIFDITAISDEGGDTDYPFFWTGTTHGSSQGADFAAYVSFGEAHGWMQIPPSAPHSLLDVHGAGSQRSDPKSGILDTSSVYYTGLSGTIEMYSHGPQGDVVRIDNHVRLVRDADIVASVNLDVDGNCTVDALTDGILILRHLFGFTDQSLVQNALALDATRTDPTEVANFLDVGKTTMLDVDADGRTDALSDGIIILRHMFGFTGTVLVEDALGPNATRIDPGVIESFLDASIPACALPSAAPAPSPSAVTNPLISDDIYSALAYETTTATPSNSPQSGATQPSRTQLLQLSWNKLSN